MLNLLRTRLGVPVDNASLVLWRIGFGALMCLEAWGSMLTGWVRDNLVTPVYTFPFMGFDALARLVSGQTAYAWYGLMGAAALGVALGWRYRMSSLGLALLWTGAYLAQKTSYNNHYYLALLLCWAMVLLPEAAARTSLDARRRGVNSYQHAFAITLGARLLLLIVFVFGSLAKLYPGWIDGAFVREAFTAKADEVLLGTLLILSGFQTFITFSAIAFDALVIPLLWWRPTRRWAFVGLVLFNIFNSIVFQIGIFPYMVLLMTVFFFDAKAPFLSRILRFWRISPSPALTTFTPELRRYPVLATAVFFLFFLVQFLLPLRHHLIIGDVNWTDEGHRLSWRMMMRTKRGYVELEAVNPATGAREAVPTGFLLSPKQARQVATKPDFLYQYVQLLRREYRQSRGWSNIKIYVVASGVWLNDAGPYPLFATDVDLAAETWRTFGHQSWVLTHLPYQTAAAQTHR